MDFRRRKRRQRTQRKKRQARKTRRVKALPPSSLNDYSPPPSPGPPNSPPGTPITRRARELASMYPNRNAMIARSTSFNENTNGMTTENFYREFERLFPEKNGPVYH